MVPPTSHPTSTHFDELKLHFSSIITDSLALTTPQLGIFPFPGTTFSHRYDAAHSITNYWPRPSAIFPTNELSTPLQLAIDLESLIFTGFFPPLVLPPGHEAAPACDDGLPGYARGENRDHLLRGGLCQRELHEPVLHPEGDCAGKCCAVVARSLHLRPPPS